MEIELNEQVVQITLTEIAPNVWNPHNSTTDELSNIANSIQEVGQIVPLIVAVWDKPIEWEGKEYLEVGKYIIIDGEQRFKALKQLFANGDNNAFNARAIVIGNVSDYEPWELAEIGQITNHTRGSIEDDVKTGNMMNQILKHRTLPDYSKLVSQRTDYLNKAMELVKNKTTNSASIASSMTKKPGSQIPQNSNRGYYTVTLAFETAGEVEEFEALISQLPDAGKNYKGLERSYRLFNALKDYFINEALTKKN